MNKQIKMTKQYGMYKMTKQIKNLEKENLIFARPVRRRPRSARRSPDSWSQPELADQMLLVAGAHRRRYSPCS